MMWKTRCPAVISRTRRISTAAAGLVLRREMLTPVLRGRGDSVTAQEVTLNGPDPRTRHPMAGFPQVCFIKNTVTNPDIVIGDYTYYDDPEDAENFERNVLYHFPF